jgi:L,D-peptidoglycan transpeptidase YkuD (ErfK/YbiS/YcfS/YnhG family)
MPGLVNVPLLVGCALGVAAASPTGPIPTASRQLLLSVSADWDSTRAELQAYERPTAREPWRTVGTPFDASLGRSGLAWGRGLQRPGLEGPQKREGDGRSPAGVFELREVTGYGPPPTTRMPYRTASSTLRCVDDPASRFYNRLVDEASVKRDWSSAEDMHRSDELYERVVWVGHNDAPVEAGRGSCIFLHLRSGPDAVTAGCTAFEPDAMARLLGWLDPQAHPVLVQLPEAEWRARAADWGLPLPATGATAR